MDEKSVLYTSSHEWIEAAGSIRRVGISDHAQHLLGDIVFVEMPPVGKKVQKGDEVLTIESPKAAASVYAPVSGEIVEINEALESAPDTINRSAYGEGWIVKIKPADFDADKGDLLAYDAYKKLVDEA